MRVLVGDQEIDMAEALARSLSEVLKAMNVHLEIETRVVSSPENAAAEARSWNESDMSAPYAVAVLPSDWQETKFTHAGSDNGRRISIGAMPQRNVSPTSAAAQPWICLLEDELERFGFVLVSRRGDGPEALRTAIMLRFKGLQSQR